MFFGPQKQQMGKGCRGINPQINAGPLYH